MINITKPIANIEINYNLVKLAKDLLNKYPIDYEKEHQKINRGVQITYQDKECFELKNIVVTNVTKSDKAVYWYDDLPLTLHYSTYRIRSLSGLYTFPQRSILYNETSEFNEPTTLIVTKWAYEKVYSPMVDVWLEDHAKHCMGLMNVPKGCPDYKRQKDFIEMLRGKEKIESESQFKSVATKIANNMRKDHNTKITFYTDGKGNLYKQKDGSHKKYSDHGHYSVYLSKKEKWKKKEPFLTSNQAEIKGIIIAIYIAVKRGYQNIEVKTDNQNAIKWINGRDSHIVTNKEEKWRTLDENISTLIDKLISISSKVPKIEINWIPRTKNFAHSV